MNEKTAFPLTWPERRPRTSPRKTNRSFKTSFAKARDNCVAEILRLGGDNIIISTNIKIRPDGIPYAIDWGKIIPDPGVAVFFTRKKKDLCFACDCWTHVQDNMHAIALTIEALRGIARWGTGDMMEAAFTGFMALPAPKQDAPHQVLGIPINATFEQAKDAYRLLVKKHHPDAGGDPDLFRRVQEAMDQIEQSQSASPR